jgi:hypothetical protein
MARRTRNDLRIKILDYIKNDAKETARLEYKREIDISDRDNKAEFIRDVIAIANSEGELPRETGYLVLGYWHGQLFDVSSKRYEASHFGKVIDAYVSPQLAYDYEEYLNDQGGKFGVLTIHASTHALFMVRKEMKSLDGRTLLTPGQCWGRRADRKQMLSGDEIQERFRDVAFRATDAARKPLTRRIDKLELESGPVLEVKRYRYQLERTRDWQVTGDILERLHPYAREFDGAVHDEVMDALHEVTGRTRNGMTRDVADTVCGLLDTMMPLAGGGMNRPAPRRISKTERAWLKRIGNVVFEMAWDACRYLRDLDVVTAASREYWCLIRFAKLNKLTAELRHFVEEAQRCQEKCLEAGSRGEFQEGYECMKQAIQDAQSV